MKKFKEIVSYFTPTNDSPTEQIEHKIPLMPGSVVCLQEGKLVPTNSFSTHVIGIVQSNEGKYSHVITSGIAYCLCQSNYYKVGDFVKVCNLIGTGTKYKCLNRLFKIDDVHKEKDSFAIVEEEIDLRTTYTGLVKVRLTNVSPVR
jgi:hypothetical protein